MTDVHQSNGAAHRGRIIEFECVVERECVNVHGAGRDTRLRKYAEFGFDQVPLGRDEENTHLVSAIGVQNLKVELDGVHVRDVLLRLPAH